MPRIVLRLHIKTFNLKGIIMTISSTHQHFVNLAKTAKIIKFEGSFTIGQMWMEVEIENKIYRVYGKNPKLAANINFYSAWHIENDIFMDEDEIEETDIPNLKEDLLYSANELYASGDCGGDEIFEEVAKAVAEKQLCSIPWASFPPVENPEMRKMREEKIQRWREKKTSKVTYEF